MKQYYNHYLQADEKRFIEEVAVAAIKEDYTKKHFLIEERGVIRYKSFVSPDSNPVKDIQYDNGSPVKQICSVDSMMLEYIHKLCGNDELALQRAKAHLGDFLKYAKAWARLAYKEAVSEDYKELQTDLHSIFERAEKNPSYEEHFMDADIRNLSFRLKQQLGIKMP
ncbi:hypothetical protein N780_13465 [Pontibacillus chungwhensis BH030062]|uniref:Uncharacterized protein n=1 Tax=Pontibacillus chungwhensis BH030062 TaxID=1385513 RepID=A0A0A2UXS0_9BACI|nr:hypothetical protein [Pontibacillus chungwhensis]KGP92729.1 hypothetical protein N780_13465 [Pontibacillus chungwhensis BH030062]